MEKPLLLKSVSAGEQLIDWKFPAITFSMDNVSILWLREKFGSTGVCHVE